jgi:hypothetical protein
MTLLRAEPMGPVIPAKIQPDLRAASRIVAQRAITLRSFGNEPIDAVVEDLSRTGFAMSTVADIAIGSIIGLSLRGTVQRRVKVVRRVGLAYGCEFLAPLSELEVNAALVSGEVIAPAFSENIGLKTHGGLHRTNVRKLSYLTRAYILGALILFLWMTLIFVGRRLL